VLAGSPPRLWTPADFVHDLIKTDL